MIEPSPTPRRRAGEARPRAPRRGPLPALVLAIAAIQAGCATMGERGVSLVPTKYQVRTGPFLIFSNSPIPADSPAVRCLHALEGDLQARLGYRDRGDQDPVEIYVLNDREAYTHFLKFYYPELPPRRAFFLAQGDRRVVYTFLSDRLEEDLRHESTHALARGYYGDLPLWLDEGLAEYFESRPDPAGRDEHMSRLPGDLRSGWTPDLARLEALKDIHEMTPRDYREAWGWVHLMLDGDPPQRTILLDYLDAARSGGRRPSFAQALAARGTTGKSLVSHIEAVQSRAIARGPAPGPDAQARDRTVRFQDRSLEPPTVRVTGPTRQGFLKRIGSWLGF
ncbi:hypothetical protein OJF2_64960 [Aquisphaera giovannonii]|uniref:DUF1570 domain-containing protein n=1 Tax=Aquisphaera giovannonii TaxID=406548 RepID=A0A5B9WCB1_9BACT|nr:hypothetical protein [Aquisphaera giovannonii]QEH37904.1 hypothetical protein OJF2_64960 [Aquisphaera giovannonii]